MIFNGLLTLMVGLLSAIVDFLPDAGSLGLGDFSGALSMAGWFNDALPIAEMMTVAGILLTVYGVKFVYGLIRQVWHFIPLIGS